MSDGLRLLTAIVNNGSTEVFRELHADLFVDEEEVNAYQYIKRHFRRFGEFPTARTVQDETNVRLPDAEEATQYYLDTVYNRKLYNEVRPLFASLRTAISSVDVESLRDITHAMARAVRQHVPEQSLLTLDETLANALETYDRHHQRPGFSGVPCGWPGIDEVTGGYQNGDLIVWVARPMVGKTYFLLHQAKAAWEAGKSVLVMSMEMTLNQLGMRIGSYLAGVDPDYARKGRLSFFAERRFRNALHAVNSAGNFHFFAGSFKKRIEELDLLIQELSPDIIFIDGIYLMRPSNQRSNMGRYEATAYVIDELKMLALERDRPVVTTTQFGREAGKGGKAGTLENIGYTDAISTHASLIFAIKMGKKSRRLLRHREEVVGQKIEYPYRVVELLKGREGEQGAFGIRYCFAPFNFYEVPAHVALGNDANDRPDLDYMD
jgi:replicative DNA helicase